MSQFPQSASHRPDGSLRRQRLAQMQVRDPQADGRFWYSVVTTGVFCRPSCPSRRARPEHVRFHDTLDEARRTGFRPCLRCCPEQPSLHERHKALIEQVCRSIRAMDAVPALEDLARSAGFSPSHFHRLFKKMTGLTPVAYFRFHCQGAGRLGLAA